MTEYVYSMAGLASREGTTAEYLTNTMIPRLKKAGGPLEWRGYRFNKTAGVWLAIPLDADVEVL